MDSFRLQIDLNHTTMGTLDDIAEALERVARDLMSGVTGTGTVYDVKGQPVGTYEAV